MIKTIVMATAAVVQTTTPLPENYEMVCQTEESVGFNWENGRYVRASFRPEAFVITVGNTQTCRANPAQARDLGTFRVRAVCANMTVVGQTVYPELAQRCTEYTSNSDAKEVMVRCNGGGIEADFAADPNGFFHFNSMHSEVRANPPGGRKDSQTLQVGRCSRTR